MIEQGDIFNQSRINTVVVCVVTSNLKRAEAPGNVSLDEGEGNLPKQSVVNVSQIFTVDKNDLEEKIGQLSRKRVKETRHVQSLTFPEAAYCLRPRISTKPANFGTTLTLELPGRFVKRL